MSLDVPSERRLASDHGQLRRRIALAHNLDVRGGLFDLVEVGPRQMNARGADIFLEPMELRRAGIGTMVGRWARSHARAICAGVAFLLSPTRFRRLTSV